MIGCTGAGEENVLEERLPTVAEAVDSLLNDNAQEVLMGRTAGLLSLAELVTELVPGGVEEARSTPELRQLTHRQLALLLLRMLRDQSEREDVAIASQDLLWADVGQAWFALPSLTSSSLPRARSGVDWLLDASVDLDRDADVGLGMSMVDCVGELARRAAEIGGL